jgi:hypothetical protein
MLGFGSRAFVEKVELGEVPSDDTAPTGLADVQQ